MYRVIVGVLALAIVTAGCGGKREATSDSGSGDGQIVCETTSGRITIATGNVGGVYYVLGGALAQLISKETQLKATAADTTASVYNIQQLGTRNYDVAFSTGDTAADAVAGEAAFDGKPQKIRALGRIHSNYTQVVVRADSGISSIADFRGKRISTGSPKSGTEVIANRLLDAAGVKAGDISRQRLALRQSVDGMKEGRIDGLVWSGGLPTPELTDLTTSMGSRVKFINISPQLPKLKKINPIYERGSVPAATYDLPANVPTIVVPNLLLVREDFAGGNACAVTKLMVHSRGELERAHPAAKEISNENAGKTGPVPLHPGARQALSMG